MAKKKTAPKDPLRAAIDELGELEPKILEGKVIAARAKVLKAIILAHVAAKKTPAEQGVLLQGDRFAVQVTAQDLERSITGMGALFDLLGREAFLEACTFALGKVDALVPASQAPLIVKQERTGSRSVKTMLVAA